MKLMLTVKRFLSNRMKVPTWGIWIFACFLVTNCLPEKDTYSALTTLAAGLYMRIHTLSEHQSLKHTSTDMPCNRKHFAGETACWNFIWFTRLLSIPQIPYSTLYQNLSRIYHPSLSRDLPLTNRQFISLLPERILKHIRSTLLRML